MQAKKINLATVVALIAGAVIGFGGYNISSSRRWFRPSGDGPFERMSHALRLTDVQHDQIDAILKESRREIGQARADFDATQRRVMINAYLRTRALLSAEQQIKFDREFVPSELQKQAQAAVNEETSVSSALVEAPTSAATPSSLPRNAAVTDQSGA